VFHKRLFIELVTRSIVITYDEIQIFETLFDIYKKLKHLTAISEYWLGSDSENKENIRYYIKYMVEVTNFLHSNYSGSQEQSREGKLMNCYTGAIVKEHEVYVNRQLVLRNIGFHKLALEILESNYFLLEITDSAEKKSKETTKITQIFSLCFEFLYGFIYNCRETKDIIRRGWNTLDKFQNLPEVGQTRVFRELYKNNL
jgi:hypothetical protein